MAIKDIIAKGIGFTPGSAKWIVTHGFSIGTAPSIPTNAIAYCLDDGTIYKYISLNGNVLIVKRI